MNFIADTGLLETDSTTAASDIDDAASDRWETEYATTFGIEVGDDDGELQAAEEDNSTVSETDDDGDGDQTVSLQAVIGQFAAVRGDART